MRLETIEAGRRGTAGPQPMDRLELVSALTIMGVAVAFVLTSLWLVLE